MYLQQEIWLILLGCIIAWGVKKNSGSTAPYRRVALFASVASFAIGEFGMLIKGVAPAIAFFPTDVRGLLITSVAAFFAAKFVVRKRKTYASSKNLKK